MVSRVISMSLGQWTLLPGPGGGAAMVRWAQTPAIEPLHSHTVLCRLLQEGKWPRSSTQDCLLKMSTSCRQLRLKPPVLPDCCRGPEQGRGGGSRLLPGAANLLPNACMCRHLLRMGLLQIRLEKTQPAAFALEDMPKV